MEGAISSFILVILTIILALGIFAFASFYLSAQAVSAETINEAQNIANGFYIQMTPPTIVNNNYCFAISLKNFNYNGTLYMTIFYYDKSLYGNPYITPEFSKGWGILDGTTGKTYDIEIYSISLSSLYQGPIKLWELSSNSIFSVSFPSNYDGILLILSYLNGKYVEVGYVWLE